MLYLSPWMTCSREAIQKNVKGKKKTVSAARSSSLCPPSLFLSLSIPLSPSSLDHLSPPTSSLSFTVYLFFSPSGTVMPAALYSVCVIFTLVACSLPCRPLIREPSAESLPLSSNLVSTNTSHTQASVSPCVHITLTPLLLPPPIPVSWLIYWCVYHASICFCACAYVCIVV